MLIINKMKKEMVILIGTIFALILISNISAGVGIKWSQESVLINEGERICISQYSVYNPWPQDSYVKIELPDSLKEVLVMQESETKFVPANTSSNNSIPVEFCFKAPKVYSRECLVGDFLCKQDCLEPQKVYDGEVSIKSAPSNSKVTGSGGSTTTMEVSAPLRLKVVCNAHPTDFSLVYILLAIISLIVILVTLYKRNQKPESERKKEKLQELKEEMKRLNKKK